MNQCKVCKDSKCVTVTCGAGPCPRSEQIAIERGELVAELLEALKSMIHLCEHDFGMDEESPYIEQANAAIAKAEGQA